MIKSPEFPRAFSQLLGNSGTNVGDSGGKVVGVDAVRGKVVQIECHLHSEGPLLVGTAVPRGRRLPATPGTKSLVGARETHRERARAI